MTKFLQITFFLANAEVTDRIFEERTTHERSGNNKKVGDCYLTINAEQEHGRPSVGSETILKVSE